MRSAGWLVAALLLGTGARAADDPFSAPVDDCRPCRFSPGTGQPSFDLRFVFDGKGDTKALTAFEITPADGGKPQRLNFEPVAASDFPTGFIVVADDLRGNGSGDLGLVTLEGADNSTMLYWLYDPATRQFVALERDADHGEDCPLVRVPAAHELQCHVKGSALEHADIFYRIEGRRTVALREIEEAVDGPLVIERVSDYTVKPPRVETATVGFFGDSPARTAFRQKLDAAATAAAARYQAGDKPGAVAALEPLLKDMDLETLTDSVPVTNGNDPADLKLVGQLNDYGFYLAEAGRLRDAAGVLESVIDLNPGRTVAYLNLADALFATGDVDTAKRHYADYQKRMIAEGKQARIPPRVAERLP
jgi:hypothetical protein